MDLVQLIAIVVSTVIFVLVVELIRRNYLKERYSLIWLGAAVVLITFSVWRKLLDYIALRIGIFYPPSFLFLLSIAFLIALLIHFSTIVSRLSESNKRLAQEIGMIKMQLGRLGGKEERERE